MSFDADEEILQDFLVEAGEILELLFEQLVDLENRSDDLDLLNAIFRGFHTIKGGAGFLQLEPLVELCHIAENVFDELRNGKLAVTPDLMDVVLKSTDVLKDMFDVVSARAYPEPAPPDILVSLHKLVEADVAVSPNTDTGSETSHQASHVEQPVEENLENAEAADSQLSGHAELNDNKNSDVIDTAQSNISDADVSSSTSSDDITEAEFEALLDQLHGQNSAPGQVESKTTLQTSQSGNATGMSSASLDAIMNSTDDTISDDEFESLLDALHGSNQVSTVASETPSSEKASVPKPIEATQNVPPVSSTAPAPAPAPAKKVPSTSSASKPSVAAKAEKKPLPNKPLSNKPVSKAATKDSPPAETTVRVDTKRLDDIMNMVGELVLVRNRLVRLGLKTTDEAMSKAVANLDVVTADLQASVMKTRMQPIKKVFGRFPRVVRDLARSLKKEVNLVLKGEETDLDKNLVEALADPLVHLVRNAVDHGVEDPETRQASGKESVGTVVLSAEQEGDHIMLTIKDDGAGMNADVLRRKAEEKGLMDHEAAERLSDNEAFHLIFHPGFSTKDQISDISGRGVGMDVVKTKITQLNGSINVSSEPGNGTTLTIKVPLTLAIMPTLMVMLGEQTFAFPLVSVNEIFHLDLTTTNEVDGQEVVIVREKPLPLFRLGEWLIESEGDIKSAVQKGQESQNEEGHVVIVSVGTQKVGFVVDQLIGQEEVVIKPLGKMLHGTAGMAGATITGDGRIALILDVPNMLFHYASRASLANNSDLLKMAS